MKSFRSAMSTVSPTMFSPPTGSRYCRPNAPPCARPTIHGLLYLAQRHEAPRRSRMTSISRGVSMPLYSANPSANTDQWFVWDIYATPPKPVFFGTMEDAGLVAAHLNERETIPRPNMESGHEHG